MSDITPLRILAEWVVADGGHRCPSDSNGFDRQCKYLVAGEGYKSKCAGCVEQWAVLASERLDDAQWILNGK